MGFWENSGSLRGVCSGRIAVEFFDDVGEGKRRQVS